MLAYKSTKKLNKTKGLTKTIAPPQFELIKSMQIQHGEAPFFKYSPKSFFSNNAKKAFGSNFSSSLPLLPGERSVPT